MSGFLNAFVGGSYGTKPDAPTVGTATATGTTTATISYTAPTNNGGVAITSYTATSSPGGITGTLSQAGSGTITVSGLTTGTAYTFTVTATNLIGTSVASSASNSITTYSLPVNTAAPVVTGTIWVGQTLSVTTGTWTGTPTPTYIYQWYRGASSISGATSSSYTLVSADLGNTMYCMVTATNAAGSTNANSNTTGTVITIPGAPTIGTASVSSTTIATTTFTAPASNGGSAITSYTVVANPGGLTNSAIASPISVNGLTPGTAYTLTVYATNVAGNSPSSAASNSVTTYSVPVNTVAPAVSGSTSFGSTLSCTTGTWTGTPASFSYFYQWKRSGSNISGATSSTYTLVSADVGLTISCRVTALNSGGNTAADSNTTGTITANAPNAPTIGTATVAGTTTATLTFTESTNDGGSGISSHYVFATPSVGSGQIVGSSPVTVTGLTPGTSYTFTVATNNGVGTSPQSAASNSITTYKVPVNTATPGISGTAQVGQTISVGTGTWSANPTPTYSYQWKRSGSLISGATSSSYLLVSADLGNTINCTVTATNSVGSAGVDSVATGTVITTAGAPTIGTATVTGTTTATVAFTAPASNGSSTITSYTAVSSPGSITGTLNQAASGTITVSGLSPNTAYTFTVYATNGAGNSASSAASNSITTNSIPINTVNAAISGTAQVGQTLTTSNGTWVGNPASYTYAYQWIRSGSNISGATSSTYTLVSADVGNTITCAVSATNASGTNTTITAATATITTVPGAPTIGTATATGQTTATVSFTAPASNGGSAITSYRAIASPGGAIVGTLNQAGSGTISCSGLSAGTAYTFTVQATNSVGNSQTSAASNSITTTVSAPTYVSGLSISGNAWVGQTLSAIGGSWTGSPTSYAYQWIRGVTDISGATGSQYVVTATDLGNTIAVRVTANNAGGSNSATSGNTAVVITTAGAPTIGTASSSATTSATVAFTAPASNGGSAITSYTAVSNPGSITGTLSQAGSGTITINGLTTGTAYTFTVYATNAAGNSSSSTASNSVTTYQLPYYSIAPTISGAQTTGTTIGLNTGGWGGTPSITGYAYQWRRGGNIISGATSQTYTIQRSDLGLGLSCDLTVTNAAGSTLYTAFASGVVTGVPDAPTIGTATATGQTTATVSFTAPSVTGGSTITTYTATSSPGGITGTLSQAGSGTINVSGLTASTAYTFTVTATNGVGTSPASSASNSITTSAAVAAPTNTQAPTVTGSPYDGQQLLASVGIWTGSPTYTYQWVRGGTSVSGATSSSYTLTSADVGSGLAVRVTATNAGGSTQVTSAYTTTVGPQQFTLVNATATPIWGTSSTATHPPSGWTDLQNASVDDGNIAVSIPGLYFNNTAQTTAYIGSNTYITFGAGSNLYSSLSATNPALDKIMMQASDNSYQRVSSVSLGSGSIVRIRYEGNASTSGTPGASGMIYEAAFFSTSRTGGVPWIEIRTGSFGRSGAANGIYAANGTNLIAASGSVTFGINQSYVLLGNSTGTSWTVYSGYYVNTNSLG